MKRRDFIASLMVAATARFAVAEQPLKTYRIAIADASYPVAVIQKPTSRIQRAFFGELRQLGYVEGKNLVIGWYSAEGHIERYLPGLCPRI
jgi:putative tryptophan/tyrosine transport system substrate-binding protein